MIEILEAGALTSVQEPVGRREWRHLGVPVGGAADSWSARLANRMAGNPERSALLEMTLIGPTLRFGEGAVIAVTGSLAAAVDGVPIAPDSVRALRRGAVVTVGSGDGARGYLAVAGGLVVAGVLGSTATDLRTGFGGIGGRALRAGDRLEAGSANGRPMRWIGRRDALGLPVRVLPGPQDGLQALLDRPFSVGTEADRTGVRLAEPIANGGEVPSMGLPLGAVQVPPDGRPIIMLADRPVTGGYRVPAIVIGADVGRVAQLRPGDEVQFASVSPEQAREAWVRAEKELAALEPLGAAEDDELGWTGSHR